MQRGLVRGPERADGPRAPTDLARAATTLTESTALYPYLTKRYWPALNGNKSAPLLVWEQGGPGSSSLFGMWVEHGPYRLNASLYPVPNPYSWANEYNVSYRTAR